MAETKLNSCEVCGDPAIDGRRCRACRQAMACAPAAARPPLRALADAIMEREAAAFTQPETPTMAELKPDKGQLNGSCNRTDCQRPGATWFNTSTRKYYCEPCALDITGFTKRVDGFHICFLTSGDAETDAALRFGVEPEPTHAR